MEKAKVLSKFFASVVTGSYASHASHVSESLGKVWESKIPLTVSKEQVQDLLMRVDVYKPMALDSKHS